MCDYIPYFVYSFVSPGRWPLIFFLVLIFTHFHVAQKYALTLCKAPRGTCGHDYTCPFLLLRHNYSVIEQ